MKLALAQMRVDGGRPEENLHRARERITEAADAGADAVLLPEALNCGWTHPSARHEAELIPGGAHFQTLADAARRSGVWICAGLIERDGESLFNSAVLIDPEGGLRLKHRKINELDIAHDLYSPGTGKNLSICDTAFGPVGVHICADGFAENQWISRELCARGAGIILSPCAWAVEADHDNESDPYGRIWRDNYRPVCEDSDVWIAGCSNVGPIDAGPWAGRKCIGNSIVFGPGGEEILTGPYGEDADTLLFVEIPSG